MFPPPIDPKRADSGATVLIVEDQRLVAADLALQLKGFGYKVVGFAASAAEAVQKARELSPEIVLMDVHLAGDVDGTEAALQIRAQSRCAIVFLTAFSDMATLERAKLAEPGGYVVKPASPVELRCAMEVALHKQRSEQRRASDDSRVLVQQLDTVRARVHELEQSYRELEAFSSSLAHDLRNPLQVITGATEMLERAEQETLTPAGRVFLHQVEAAAERMMERLTALLELARTSRTELVLTEFDLGELVREVWSELAADADIRLQVADGMKVRADRTLVRRLLENVLSNAIKFSARRDAPEIEVGVAQDATQTCYFVRDNGVGFSMQSAEGRLFTPYGRLHDARSYPGTGLGLAGARRIAERHGGRMWAHGVEGVGATFYFTLVSPGA